MPCSRLKPRNNVARLDGKICAWETNGPEREAFVTSLEKQRERGKERDTESESEKRKKTYRDLKFVVYNVSFGQDKHNFHRR